MAGIRRFDHVGVTVDVDLLHVLDVAGALALDPELVPRRAPVRGPASLAAGGAFIDLEDIK